MHILVRYLMIASLLATAVSWWMKDVLPPPAQLKAELLEEPKQIPVRKAPIDTTVNGIDYRIQPRYAYDISGLVVSLHHSDTWWDYAHKEWGDHINLMDLCVVWGGNAQTGAYKNVSFSNNQWECHWSWSHSEPGREFNNAEASNNHMVTDDPAVARALRKIRIGDQIRLKGYLVDYSVGGRGGSRVSSGTRTDSGNGACEVLYVESVEIRRLKSSRPSVPDALIRYSLRRSLRNPDSQGNWRIDRPLRPSLESVASRSHRRLNAGPHGTSANRAQVSTRPL